jgi:hypothetical protein
MRESAVFVMASALADATLVLAAATVALAVISVLGIRSARTDVTRQIDAMRTATDEQLAAAREELDAAHRPLLIEVFASGPIYPDMGARSNPSISRAAGREIPETISLRFDGTAPSEIDPRFVFVDFERGMAFISVPLRNVGRGLAVVVESDIAANGDALYDLKAPPSASRVRVPVGETTRVNIVARQQAGVSVGPGDQWAVTVPYTDFAGRQRTVARVILERSDSSPAPFQWHIASVEDAA